MQVTAKLNYLRIAPRKVRLVTALIRKKKVEEAQAVLNFTVKRASRPLLKLLNSAVANARNNLKLDPDNLYISKVTVDEGRKYKRWRARARGRAAEIQKKTSHITLILEEMEPGKKVKKKRVKKEIEDKEKKEKSVSSRIAADELKSKDAEKEKKQAQEIKKLKERSMIETTPKPKSKGGIRRMFRRKSF